MILVQLLEQRTLEVLFGRRKGNPMHDFELNYCASTHYFWVLGIVVPLLSLYLAPNSC